jgi:hypothetical protein
MYWVAKTLHLTPEPEAWKAVDSSALAPFAETATKRSSPSGALNAEASIQELNSDDLTYLTSPSSSLMRDPRDDVLKHTGHGIV